VPKTKSRPLPRKWTIQLVSYHRQSLGLVKLGGVIVGSRAVVVSRLSGTPPVDVGRPGDGLQGLAATASFLNEYFGVADALPDDQGDWLTEV
jgi:hypothetical protein